MVRPRRSANFRPKEVHFLNDELLHAFDRVLLFKEKVEFLTRVGRSPVSLLLANEKRQFSHIWADRFIRRIVPDGEVRMLQCLFTGDSLRGIKVQHLGEQIESEWVRVWKQLRERHPWPDGQGTDVILCLDKVQAVGNTTKSF